MSLIKTKSCEKEKVKISINADVMKEVRNYCEWAKVAESDFFEQAALHIFKKDTDWNKKNKKVKSTKASG